MLNVETWSDPITLEKKCEEKIVKRSRFATIKRNQITISRLSIAYIFILFCMVSVVVIVVVVVVVVRTLFQPSIRHAVRLTTFCIELHQPHPWCTRDAHTIPRFPGTALRKIVDLFLRWRFREVFFFIWVQANRIYSFLHKRPFLIRTDSTEE